MLLLDREISSVPRQIVFCRRWPSPNPFHCEKAADAERLRVRVYRTTNLSLDHSLMCPASSRVEGIGRPRVKASFLSDVVDRVLKVPDAASFAALHFLHRVIERK